MEAPTPMESLARRITDSLFGYCFERAYKEMMYDRILEELRRSL